jgi:hypothetical protein
MEDWFATDQFIENTKQRWIGSQGRSRLGIHSGITALGTDGSKARYCRKPRSGVILKSPKN